jgi:hypothetical protein
MRSSPGLLSPPSGLRLEESYQRVRRRSAFRSWSETSEWSARELVRRAALFAAPIERPCRSQRRKPWRERPRCARPTRPRARPEGSLTPWLSLSLQVVEHSMFGGEKRRVLPHRTCLVATQIFRTIRSCSAGKCCPQSRHIRSVFAGQFCREKWRLALMHSTWTCCCR